MDFDFRVVIVLLPILLAGGWAVFNIGAAALRQVQKLLNN
jgi:photosystem II PsbY protein